MRISFIVAAGLFLFALGETVMRAADTALPGGAFEASRYQALWESSPFSVATPVATESTEYSLVGAAEFDGVSYVSLIEKQSQSQNHFVVTSKAPVEGLTLVGIEHGKDPKSTYATLQKNGALIRLKIEAGSAAAGAPPVPAMRGMMGSMPMGMANMVRRFAPGSPQLSEPIGRPPPAQRFPPIIYVPRPPPSPR